jgi:integrase
LQWGDVDGNQIFVRRTVWNTIAEERTKTDASRAPVPLVPVLKKWLEAHRNGRPETDFIFGGDRRGRPLNLANLARRVISPTLQKEGSVKWRGWHGFRRGLATNLYAIGTDGGVVQDILRHADVKVTRSFYIKPTSESSQRAMKGLEKLFKSLKKGKRS